MLNLDNIVSNKKKSSLEDNDWPFRMLNFFHINHLNI